MIKGTYIAFINKLPKDEVKYIDQIGADSIIKSHNAHQKLFKKIDEIIIRMLKEIKKHVPNNVTSALGDAISQIDEEKVKINLHKLFRFRFFDTLKLRNAYLNKNVPAKDKSKILEVLRDRGIAR